VQPFGSGSPGTACELHVPTMDALLEFADEDELSDWLGAERLDMC
jgi:hypothetical protein